MCERDKGAWNSFSQNLIEDTAHRSDVDYRMCWRFMTQAASGGPTSLASFASSSTCVPGLSRPMSPMSPLSPLSPMSVLDDEINDNFDLDLDTRYSEDELFIIQTNYDHSQNIDFHPGRKRSNEDDFTYAQRIYVYTERERERADQAILPKNLDDFSEKVCQNL